MKQDRDIELHFWKMEGANKNALMIRNDRTIYLLSRPHPGLRYMKVEDGSHPEEKGSLPREGATENRKEMRTITFQ